MIKMKINLTKNEKELQRLVVIAWLKLKREVNSKHMQIYKAGYNESIKTQEKELVSKYKQNYRASPDESLKAQEKEVNPKKM